MNMIYEEDVLYVDVIGEITKKRFKDVKTRIYDLVDFYKVGGIVLNYDKELNKSPVLIDDFVSEYKEKYKSTMKIL